MDINEVLEGGLIKWTGQKSGLSPEELYQIAQEAKKLTYMDGHVQWINAALMEAKNKTKDAKFINKLR